MTNRRVVYIALQQFCEQDPAPRQLLADAGFEVRENTLGRRLRAEDLPEQVGSADAVVAGVEPYDAGTLAALPRLQCISRCGVGTDSIDLAAARERGIAVYTTPDEVTQPVAELTIAMLLALARHLPAHLEDFRAGRWQKRTGSLLSEWTVGLVGFGRVGRAVERLLRPFGPQVLVADPTLGRPDQVPAGVEVCALPSLLARSDAVSLHAGRPAQDGPLLGARELAQMKRGSYLVNTARGHLVDHAALAQALTSGHLAGAALDVFTEEPYTGPLSRRPNVLCTPHVATLTRASRVAMETRAAQHLVEHFQRPAQRREPGIAVGVP